MVRIRTLSPTGMAGRVVALSVRLFKLCTVLMVFDPRRHTRRADVESTRKAILKNVLLSRKQDT